MFILLFVLLTNLWIWKIGAFSILLALLLLIITILLYLSPHVTSQLIFLLFVFLFIILLFAQYQTTQKVDLTYLDNDEQRVQQMRLREYPVLPIPIGWWFEGREESIAAFRIQKNLSELLDPNLYFFANHPRERVGIAEFEKFPYFFLPFFLVGLVHVIRSNHRAVLLSTLFLPILVISIIGHKNPLGPFSLFPFLVITTTYGTDQLIKVLPVRYNTKFIFSGIILFAFIFVQTIAYAKF